LNLDLPVAEWAKEEGIADQEIRERLLEASDRLWDEKVASFGDETMRSVEKDLLLRILDHQWKDHLLHLDYLRQGIHLRGYGQRDPLNEYKREAFDLFEAMLANLRTTVSQVLSNLEIRMQEEPPPEPLPPSRPSAPPRCRPAPGPWPWPAAATATWRRSTSPTRTPCARYPATRPARAAPGASSSSATGRLV
jgi:preprotein translocase subunit SecA